MLKCQRFVFRSTTKFIIILLIIAFGYLSINRERDNFQTVKDDVHIHIFNLSLQLEPKYFYDEISCRKSSEIYVSTTLCVHDLNRDENVSAFIWRDGVWERHIIKHFLDYIKKNPDWLVLDVGAQIGQYSLFAAKMGRDVVCVEPFYENILRIHKAAFSENLSSRITLIKNALSNKRNEVKKLKAESRNIGGQSLLENKDQVFDRSQLENDKYLVETIFFDDLINYLPKKPNGEEYRKAILKIDIEGFEPYAFQNANKLFDRLDIRIIFMEWGNLPMQSDNHGMILEMIKFLRDRNFIPFGNNVKLNDSDWKKWPWDIFWEKLDILTSKKNYFYKKRLKNLKKKKSN
ncbi:unnamed protein product [Brachionus calyciflorus]|uniref:Methyltransferase FkbM domain-containing protein n=1 Tax=Brachionus calyciflorus TaxID=104777 RepID=A0A813V9X3_9BILA|nr:unnamed protein product [Brachionus calyciflorus]